VLLVGAVALTLGGCGRLPPAKPKEPTYACSYIEGGKTQTCFQYTNLQAPAVAELKHGCPLMEGQVFTAAACTTDGLVGCCAHRRPDGVTSTVCYYKGGPLVGRPDLCAKDGDAWSSAP
jgi:hypothetical protein